MPDFVYDDLPVPDGKSDARPLTGNPANFVRALEWNTVMSYLESVRTAIRDIGGDVPTKMFRLNGSVLEFTEDNGFSWSPIGTSSLAANPVGSSPNANGATIGGGFLTLQPADGTNPGVLSAGTQTIGGNKLFSGQLRTDTNLALTASVLLRKNPVTGVLEFSENSGSIYKEIPYKSVYNVKTYGARGNQSNDDTAAIQAAIDAIGSGTGVLYFPAGDYLITDTLKYHGNNGNSLWVKGDVTGRGPTGTSIQWAGKYQSLAYDNQTVDFTLGQILTGTNSAATGTIIAITDNGVTGVLGLSAVSGIFRNNEPITDGAGGAADVNGYPSRGITVEASVGNVNEVYTATFNNHPFRVGDILYQEVAQANFPAGYKQIRSITTNTFTWRHFGGTGTNTSVGNITFVRDQMMVALFAANSLIWDGVNLSGGLGTINSMPNATVGFHLTWDDVSNIGTSSFIFRNITVGNIVGPRSVDYLVGFDDLTLTRQTDNGDWDRCISVGAGNLRLDFDNLTGGSFSVGDTVSDTGGADFGRIAVIAMNPDGVSGTLAISSNQALPQLVTPVPYAAGEVLDNGMGVTADIVSVYSSDRCVKILSTGNVKDFRWYETGISGYNTGIDVGPGSGIYRYESGALGGNGWSEKGADIRPGRSQFAIHNVSCEAIALCGERFIDNQGQSRGQVLLDNCQLNLHCAPDDIGIYMTGRLTVNHCYIYNARLYTSSFPSTPFKIVGNPAAPSLDGGSMVGGAMVITNNLFLNIVDTKFLPLYDGGGNFIGGGDDAFGKLSRNEILAFGNIDDDGTIQHLLRDVTGRPGTLDYGSLFRDGGVASNVIYEWNGDQTRLTMRIRIAYSDFVANANLQTIDIGSIQGAIQPLKLKDVYLNVDPFFDSGRTVDTLWCWNNSLPYMAATGSFTVGETITGSPSGDTATVVAGEAISPLRVSNASGDFSGDTLITGGTSLVTATPTGALTGQFGGITIEIGGQAPVSGLQDPDGLLLAFDPSVLTRMKGRDVADSGAILTDAANNYQGGVMYGGEGTREITATLRALGGGEVLGNGSTTNLLQGTASLILILEKL